MKPSDISRWQTSAESWLAQGWVTAGVQVNPVANTVLADTGPMALAWYDFICLIGSSTAIGGYIDLQHRNTLNDANIGYYTLMNIAGENPPLYINNYRMTAQERMRFIVKTNLTARVTASIIYKRRA